MAGAPTRMVVPCSATVQPKRSSAAASDRGELGHLGPGRGTRIALKHVDSPWLAGRRLARADHGEISVEGDRTSELVAEDAVGWGQHLLLHPGAGRRLVLVDVGGSRAVERALLSADDDSIAIEGDRGSDVIARHGPGRDDLLFFEPGLGDRVVTEDVRRRRFAIQGCLRPRARRPRSGHRWRPTSQRRRHYPRPMR